MKIKATLLAAALVALPGVAAAMCWDRPHEQTASSCTDGQVWDADAGSCVTPMSS